MMQFSRASVTLLESKTQIRERFLGNLLAITGDTRLLWTPRSTDTTTSTDESLNAATLTADATMASQLTALGNGYARTFDGAANYLTTPDRADLSFGSGTADQAFSLLALVNVTDTAFARDLVTKNGASNAEWTWRVLSTDAAALFLTDQSVGTSPHNDTNAAITQGAWTLLGVTYSGVGGATAASGITHYVNGLAVASTATNSGTYVATENLAAPVEIGSDTTHTANFFQGQMALLAVVAGALSASQMWSLKRLCNAFYGLSL